MKRFKTVLITAIALLLCMQMCIIAFAGATMSFSKSNVKVGDSVTVTVTVSGKNIAGVQFNINYDSSMLTLKSCSDSSGGGKVMWYHDSGSVSSHSTTFVFSANKTGRTYIGTSGMLVSDSNADPISGFSDQGANLTISSEETTTKAPETTTKKQETTTRRQETTTRREESTTKETTTETTTEKPKNDEITLGGKTYKLVDDSAFVNAPDGFDETYSDYKGEKILTYTSKDKSQQIVCVMDEDGKKIFALFDDEKDSFSEFIKIKSESLPLVMLTAKDNVLPESYLPVNIEIKEQKITAYQNEEFKAKGLYLIYAMNLNDGKSALYVYDDNDKTIQRYYGLDVTPEETTTQPTTEAVKTEEDGIPLKKQTMIKAICALGVLLLAAFIAIITLAIKLKKKVGSDDDELYIIDETDNYSDYNNYTE